VAVEIALRNRIRWSVLEGWSEAEGFRERYDRFQETVLRARKARPAPERHTPRDHSDRGALFDSLR